MVVLIERDGWTRTPRPAAKLTRLDPADVLGIAVHWTGSSAPLGQTATLAQSVRRLEQERAFHVAPTPQGRGWTDIAYQVAQDVEGRVFDARGIGYRSAANGDATVNRQWGAVTWLLGKGDRPTPAMVAAFLEWRRDYWLPAYPRATRVVGHRDLHPTECPGDVVHALIRSGDLTHVPARPAPPKETTVPVPRLDPADIEAIAARAAVLTAELVTSVRARNPVLVEEGTGAAELPDGRDIDAFPTVIGEIQAEQARQGEVLARIARALDGARGVVG